MEAPKLKVPRKKGETRPDADTTVKLTRAVWDRIITGEVSVSELLTGDEIDIDGSRLKLIGFFAMLDVVATPFAIATP